jgi:hypothetical protein
LADGVVLVDDLRNGDLGADSVGRSCEKRLFVILDERDIHHSGKAAEAADN